MKMSWKYLKHSNIKLAFDLNPFFWGFRNIYEGPDKASPDLHIWYIRFLPFVIILTIDTGKFIVYDDYENIEVADEI